MGGASVTDRGRGERRGGNSEGKRSEKAIGKPPSVVTPLIALERSSPGLVCGACRLIISTRTVTWCWQGGGVCRGVGGLGRRDRGGG